MTDRLLLIRRSIGGRTHYALIRETRRTKKRVYGKWLDGSTRTLTTGGYAPLNAVLCEDATPAQLAAIRAAEAAYSATIGAAREQFQQVKDVAFVRLEAAIRKAVGR